MDKAFAANLRKTRWRYLAFDGVFLIAGILGAIDCYHLSNSSAPGPLPTYGFVVLFAFIMATLPTKAYVLTRCIKRWHVDICPYCHRPLWQPAATALQTAIFLRCPG